MAWWNFWKKEAALVAREVAAAPTAPLAVPAPAGALSVAGVTAPGLAPVALDLATFNRFAEEQRRFNRDMRRQYGELVDENKTLRDDLATVRQDLAKVQGEVDAITIVRKVRADASAPPEAAKTSVAARP